jgi:hypothetical protein
VFFKQRQKSLSLEQLRLLVTLAEQVVLALEQTARSSGSEKKRLALHMLADLVQAHGLDPPQLLLDTVIEAAVRLTR